MWVSIIFDSASIATTSGNIFHVSFDVRSRESMSSADEIEILRIDQTFFGNLLRLFIRTRGSIHLNIGHSIESDREWPKLIATESQLDVGFDSILRTDTARTYPIVVWFEPTPLREFHVIDEDELLAAAQDMGTLDELIAAGLPRLFLDEQFGDLLADERDRGWIYQWIEESVEGSKAIITRLE